MSISLCLNLKASMFDISRTDLFEKEYQTVFKPALKFLFSHQNFTMSFSFNGVQLSLYRKKHPEFFEIIEKLIERKQIEILGGGYYDPIFPLLFPRDRSGQIDLLSSLIRETTGKRPRGISICESIWDSALVPCFATAGMEYVLLDESLIQPDKNCFIPLIMSDKGKSIAILPIENSFIPESENADVQDFFRVINAKISKSSKNSYLANTNQNKGITLEFTPLEFKSLLDCGFFHKLNDEIENNPDGLFQFKTPLQFVKESNLKTSVYIPSGMNSGIAQWAYKPYQAVKVNKMYPVTIFDFLETYPQSRALYDRMLYLSMLVNMIHGDKLRKKAARDKLWESQSGNSFICTAKGAFVDSSHRQNSYKNLIEAEKILRECCDFNESISSFDYNGNGINEYVLRMQGYNSVISIFGGAIREFDVKESGNYADNLNRVEAFEGYDDNYERGLFIDHLFSDEEFESYLQNKPSGNGIFSNRIYSETKFNSQQKSVLLGVEAAFQNKQKVSLRKKYVATSSGMMIQYILKNESEKTLNAKFAVESSFAQINFNAEDFNAYKLEIVTDGNKQEIDTKASSKQLNESGKLSNVEGFQLTDVDNQISFFFEPNEACGLSFVPIVFNRPEYTTGELVPASMTFANTLFWDVNLEPGREMEKTINLSIFNMHKKQKAPRKK